MKLLRSRGVPGVGLAGIPQVGAVAAGLCMWNRRTPRS